MGMTNAERQAAYRARHLKAEDGTLERPNITVSVSAKAKLGRLASCYGTTQRGVLESLLEQAERALVESLPATDRAAYYDRKLSLLRNGPPLRRNIVVPHLGQG